MSWTVVIPGQPPSTNHAYKIVTVKRGTGGIPFRTLAKTDEAISYQMAARLLVAAARPSGWRSAARVRLTYRLYLTHKQDADNSLKLLNDAIARALNINDDKFLPCVESKEIVKVNPRVEVTIT